MKKWLYRTLVVLFSAVFLFSAAMLIRYWIDSHAQQESYDQLSALVQQARPAPSDEIHPDPTAPASELPTPWITINDPETGQPVQLLPDFAQLYTMNNDLAGWIRVPGTKVDYPMMQTPDSPDFYLRRDFEKKKNSHGSIYIKEDCDPDRSDNVIIYGHRMNNGTMFGSLGKYKKKAFWQEHKTILLDTLTHRRTYEIFAVFLTTASAGRGFQYHTYVDMPNSEQFDSFVTQCKDLSYYDTGITPQYGEKLITLSTCDNGLTNGRLVVVARLIEET